MINNIFFSLENRVLYVIMWKNMIEGGRPQMTGWRVRMSAQKPFPQYSTDPHKNRVHINYIQQHTHFLKKLKFFRFL